LGIDWFKIDLKVIRRVKKTHCKVKVAKKIFYHKSSYGKKSSNWKLSTKLNVLRSSMTKKIVTL